jgi:hypothetical protein
LRTYREIEEDESTADQRIDSHLDELAGIIAALSIDFELAGLNTDELKTLAVKQAAYKRRRLEKRFEVLDGVMILMGRLEHATANQATADPLDDAGGWVEIEGVGNFILERNRVAVHADDAGNPHIKRERSSKANAKRPSYRYFVRPAKLAEYIKPRSLEKYGSEDNGPG